MKQIIKDVLRRYEDSQQNLSSESARNLIASEIEAVLGHKGTYHEYTDSEVEEQKDRESWVCSICGKSTYDVDWDYLGSGTNHLGCELELEDVNLNKRINQHHELYQKLGPPTNGLESGSPEDYGEKPFIYVRDKNKIKTRRMTGEEYGYYKNRKFYSPTSGKERGKFTTQKQLYNELTADGLPPGGDAEAVKESYRLAEEIVDSTSKGYIYESPDGGKTVYRRERGDVERKLVEDWEGEKKKVEDNFNKRLEDK